MILMCVSYPLGENCLWIILLNDASYLSNKSSIEDNLIRTQIQKLRRFTSHDLSRHCCLLSSFFFSIRCNKIWKGSDNQVYIITKSYKFCDSAPHPDFDIIRMGTKCHNRMFCSHSTNSHFAIYECNYMDEAQLKTNLIAIFQGDELVEYFDRLFLAGLHIS